MRPLVACKHVSVAVVALANKTARLDWTLWG